MNKVKIGYNHPLCKALQAKGYSIRLSQDIVCAVFDRIKESLLNKEDVDLPIGQLLIKPETRKKQRRIGINGPCWVFKSRWKIVFKEPNE
jgi:nucleoid DNA-binding protein